MHRSFHVTHLQHLHGSLPLQRRKYDRKLVLHGWEHRLFLILYNSFNHTNIGVHIWNRAALETLQIVEATKH